MLMRVRMQARASGLTSFWRMSSSLLRILDLSFISVVLWLAACEKGDAGNAGAHVSNVISQESPAGCSHVVQPWALDTPCMLAVLFR